MTMSDGDGDLYAREREYFAEFGPKLPCRTCGKIGVTYFPNGPNSNLNIEHGGWCSEECFRADIEA